MAYTLHAPHFYYTSTQWGVGLNSNIRELEVNVEVV